MRINTQAMILSWQYSGIRAELRIAQYRCSPPVAHFRDLRAIAVRREAGRAEMVAEEILHRHWLGDNVFPHGNSLCPGIVVLGDLCAGQFIVIAHKVRGHAIDSL